MIHHQNKLAVLALTTAATLFGYTGAANAQITHAHIDRLALQLQRQTEDLHHEVDAHFRGTPDYAHLHRDVAEMERLAEHIHDVAHDRGSVSHLRADVEKYDRLFHHVEDLTRRLIRTRQIGFRTVQHFNEVLRGIDDTLHHLRDDLAQLVVPHHHPQHGYGPYPSYRTGPRNYYPPTTVPSIRFGIRW